MNEYENPYFIMIRASGAALRAMEKNNFGQAQEILICAQQQAEDAVLSYSESSEEGNS